MFACLYLHYCSFYTIYQRQAWTACVLASQVVAVLLPPLLAKCSNTKVCVTGGQATIAGARNTYSFLFGDLKSLNSLLRDFFSFILFLLYAFFPFAFPGRGRGISTFWPLRCLRGLGETLKRNDFQTFG